MNKHLQKFMILQLSPYMSESESNERVELFLRYLDVICEHSLNDQDFEVLRRRLENIAECDYLDSDSLDQALSIEPFLRELYCLDTGDHSQVSFSKVMISFNVFPKNYLDNNQESWIFNTAPETASTKNYFKNLFYPFTEAYSFVNVYLCRNVKAHNLKTLSLIDRATLFTDILNVFVTSTWKKKARVLSHRFN